MRGDGPRPQATDRTQAKARTSERWTLRRDTGARSVPRAEVMVRHRVRLALVSWGVKGYLPSDLQCRAQGAWVWSVAIPVVSECANPLVQARPFRAEEPGRARDVAIGLAERVADALAFGGVAHFLQTCARTRGLGLPYLQRDRVEREAFPLREDHHALHDVPQLADVPWPAVPLEDGQDVRIDLAGPHVVPRAELRKKERRELADVLAPLAERWHRSHHAEAIEEVLPERARAHEGLEPAGCRRDDASADPNRPLAAHALQFTILQDA